MCTSLFILLGQLLVFLSSPRYVLITYSYIPAFVFCELNKVEMRSGAFP